MKYFIHHFTQRIQKYQSQKNVKKCNRHISKFKRQGRIFYDLVFV